MKLIHINPLLDDDQSIKIPVNELNFTLGKMFNEEPMMLFLKYEDYQLLNQKEKKSLNIATIKDYSIDEMLNMYLTILIDDNFDILEFTHLVESVKGDKHNFCKITKVER